MNWRIVNDRRPLIGALGDKLRMKDYVAATGAGVHIPRTLWAGHDLGELVDVELPAHWVLKPNHRSNGTAYFGSCSIHHPDELARHTAGFLDAAEAIRTQREWIYEQARRLILVEELIGTPGTAPSDYKFFVFDGNPMLVQVDSNRFSGHHRRLYRPDWTPFEMEDGGYPLAPVIPPPAGLDRMLEAVRTIGAEFDFIRVDLYNIDGEVYFGELTPYPASGLKRIKPSELDFELGSHWTLPSL